MQTTQFGVINLRLMDGIIYRENLIVFQPHWNICFAFHFFFLVHFFSLFFRSYYNERITYGKSHMDRLSRFHRFHKFHTCNKKPKYLRKTKAMNAMEMVRNGWRKNNMSAHWIKIRVIYGQKIRENHL